jgi:hypothetical protein
MLSPVVRIEQHENYVKQTYRNRCRIATANGILQLSIPVVKHHGQKMPVRDVRIDYTEQWQQNHWKAIVSAYRSSPFFEYYADDIRPFYEQQEKFLFDLNNKILLLSTELIGIKIDVGFTDKFAAQPSCHDYRYAITPKLKQAWPDNKFKPQIYYQVFAPNNGFAANLSILDLLCNEGPNSLQVLSDCII